MKFLVDIGVGKKVETWLKDNRFDVVSVRDINPKAKDADILTIAAKQERIVITMDKDFGELIFNSGMTHAGVLILRMEDATGDQKADAIQSILSKFSGKIEGMFCVYQDGRLRVRS